MIEALKSDEIVNKVGGRFKLTALIQKRLVEIIDGARPLIERESGMTDLFTLAQSVNALNRAEIDRFVTNGNAWRALLLKAAAAGDLDIFLSQLTR